MDAKEKCCYSRFTKSWIRTLAHLTMGVQTKCYGSILVHLHSFGEGSKVESACLYLEVLDFQLFSNYFQWNIYCVPEVFTFYFCQFYNVNLNYFCYFRNKTVSWSPWLTNMPKKEKIRKLYLSVFSVNPTVNLNGSLEKM